MGYSKETAFICQKLEESDLADWGMWPEAPPELSGLVAEVEKMRELSNERLREIAERLGKFNEEV